MFLLTEESARARVVMGRLAADLPVPVAPIHEVELGSSRLLWTRAQVRDNLHVYSDGAFIGLLDPAEALSDEPLPHDRALPDRFDPLLPGVVLRRRGDELEVEPLGVTAVFTSGSSVSDRQLLLAGLGSLRPSAAGVALLASMGYFPGNLTLFSEVERVPFLHRWDVRTRRATRARSLALPKADDLAMIDRLVSLVPTDATHALGLSGGHDSRFVLGVLHRAGAAVRIVRFDDEESDVVDSIARELGLEVETIGGYGGHDGRRTAAEFTLMTDAQIWHGVAQHGRLGQRLATSDLFHSGQFSPSMTKNTFRTAWKKPDPRTPFWDRLVVEGFLGNVPSVQPTLRSCTLRSEVAEVVDRSLQYQREYVDFAKRKQWANWMYYMNRGMRWSQAFYDDLTFTTNLTFILADIDAQLLGIASGFWDNFHNDRLSRLNHVLLPEVRTGYASGQGVLPQGGPRGATTKIEYEFVSRWRTSRTARAKLAGIETTYEEDLPAEEPSGYDAIFDRPMHEVAHQGGFGLRRTNVTVSNVLQFLTSIPSTGPQATAEV